jgi:SAM-dependent methyltransferase
MRWFRDHYLLPSKSLKILDVGSYDVNGSYRQLFPSDSFEYTGMDMAPGPNVDIVPRNTYNWSEIDSESFDVVISGQAFEHIEFFWLTMAEMVRVAKRDGLFCIIAPNGFGEHRYPVDCWRFFTDGLVALARYTSLEILHAHTNCTPETSPVNAKWLSQLAADSMLVAKKPYSGNTRILDTASYQCIPANHQELRKGMLTQEETIAIQKAARRAG